METFLGYTFVYFFIGLVYVFARRTGENFIGQLYWAKAIMWYVIAAWLWPYFILLTLSDVDSEGW